MERDFPALAVEEQRVKVAFLGVDLATADRQPLGVGVRLHFLEPVVDADAGQAADASVVEGVSAAGARQVPDAKKGFAAELLERLMH